MGLRSCCLSGKEAHTLCSLELGHEEISFYLNTTLCTGRSYLAIKGNGSSFGRTIFDEKVFCLHAPL